VARVLGAMKWAWAIGWTFVWAVVGIVTWPLSPRGKLYLRCARTWSRIVLWGCGIRVEPLDRPRLDPDRPYCFISSHESIFDIMALFIAIPVDVRMLSKIELRKIPLLGWSMWMAGFIFIDRSSATRAKRSVDRAADAVRGGRSIVVFPEGTRGDGTDLLPFKSGGFVIAIRAGVPIVPIAISGSAATLPKHTIFPQSGTIRVRFGEPIETARVPIGDKQALTSRVEDRVRELKTGERRRLAA